MSINEAKELLLEFYQEYSSAVEDPAVPLGYEEGILQDWAMRLIDRGQWS